MKKVKQIVLLAAAALLTLSLSVATLFKTPTQYSMSERRQLAGRPALSWEDLLSGRFMTNFENFAADQFPLRDRFRTLRAAVSRYLFGQRDYHGIYEVDGYLSKLEYPENREMTKRASEKLQSVYDTWLKDTDCRVYLSMIPDKNYFTAPLGGYPSMDYGALVDRLRGELNFADYIDIFGTLSLSDYYRTDQHWRQECVLDTARLLARGMRREIDADFTEKTLDVPFYGTYHGQSALPYPPDELRYLTNDMLDACTVTSFDTGVPKPGALYDRKRAEGRDPYEMFLMGANALTVIENPAAQTDAELVLFRDSFGSSLAPLLVPAYAKITLIDLRYIPSDRLGAFLTFDGQDVLFLYSTLILNNGAVLT